MDLGIFQGELPAKEREDARLPENALGGIWRPEGLTHGWFYLKADDYVAVWDQVRDGGYETCQINLGVQPNPYNTSSFVIGTASITFTRQVIQQEPKKDTPPRWWSVGYTNRWWAIVLCFIATMVWLFPRSEITAGESEIVGAILFVGGLLLWFLL